jgi:hypothetical protein
VINDELVRIIKKHMEFLQRGGQSTADWFEILQKIYRGDVNVSCVRTDILCPNCMKKRLMEYRSDDGGHEIWCDECGQEYVHTGNNSVRFK